MERTEARGDYAQTLNGLYDKHQRYKRTWKTEAHRFTNATSSSIHALVQVHKQLHTVKCKGTQNPAGCTSASTSQNTAGNKGTLT